MVTVTLPPPYQPPPGAAGAMPGSGARGLPDYLLAAHRRHPQQNVLYSYPRFSRSAEDRVLGGVCGGLAALLGLQVSTVRAVLVLSGLVGGFGVVLYIGLWLLTPVARLEDPQPQSAAYWQQPAGTPLHPDPDRTTPAAPPGSEASGTRNLLLAIAALLVFVPLGSTVVGLSWHSAVGLLCASAGAVVMWRQLDKNAAQGSMWGDGRRGWTPLTFGVMAVFVGMQIAVFGFTAWWLLIGLVLASLVVAVIILVPMLRGLVDDLVAERSARARADERDVIASHLHDSVLQTLALIQKNSEPGSEVQRLARQQERQLRQWLFGDSSRMSTGATTLAAALEVAASEVDDAYGLSIRPVTVGGDLVLDEASTAAVDAAREAMVNAAKHAGVDTLDVYAEASEEGVEIFIRDRGCGFDPESVSEDRHGIAQSIHARMQRVGGEAEIRSAVGRGTTVMVRTVAHSE